MPTRTFGDVRVELSRLDKVLYPATGTTKGAVLDYLVEIAPAMIPHIAGRPVTRKRWPNGVDQSSFFEKNLVSHAPDWVERRPIEHKGGRAVEYPLFDTVAGLAWLGQQAALEIHVPQWRFRDDGEPGPPTRLVFDLDPGEDVSLAQCAHVAVAVRDMLADVGLTAYPLTSGSKGIHLYVPLDRHFSAGGASTVAKQVATNLEKLHPDLVTATMAKAARGGKVFLDWSQNNPSKTTIAPYSMRGRPEPTVAAPRSWEEIEDADDLAQLTFDEVLRRYRTDGDLLAELDPVPDSLEKYRSMRDPAKTTEPMPARKGKGRSQNRFVIQEHHARALHWDLRLERDGVLVCWAVPKGVPKSSRENRLAVHTEDHPLEYLTFAGTIPKGEYGGGEMTVWDTGTYETEKWRPDEVIVRLDGERTQGRFALIQTKGDQWLMHLMKEQEPAGDSAEATAKSGVPTGLAPMLATAGTVDDLGAEDWCFEAKWDGFRLVVTVAHGDLRLNSRSGNDVTDRYPGLATLAAELADHDVVLDGEVVVFDEHGRADFGLLQSGGADAEFMAFDILYIDGTSLLRKRYTDRRKVLEALAAKTPSMVVPPLLDGDGAEALRHSREEGWEGIVAKRRESVYQSGKRAHTWIKAKNLRTQEAVIGGWKRGQGGRSGRIGSLFLGIPSKDGLRYVGKVGTGFSEKTLADLAERFAPLVSDVSPFDEQLPVADRRDAVWLTPTLVGEVQFMDWTGPRRLRHPSWRGLREDKRPEDVVEE